MTSGTGCARTFFIAPADPLTLNLLVFLNSKEPKQKLNKEEGSWRDAKEEEEEDICSLQKQRQGLQIALLKRATFKNETFLCTLFFIFFLIFYLSWYM